MMSNLEKKNKINKILFKSLANLYTGVNRVQIDKIKKYLDLYHCERKTILIEEINENSDIDLLSVIINKFCTKKNILFFHYSSRKYEIFSFNLITSILEFIYKISPDSFLYKYPRVTKFIQNIKSELYYDYLEIVDFIIEFGKINQNDIVIFLKDFNSLNNFEKYFFYFLSKNLSEKKNLNLKYYLV